MGYCLHPNDHGGLGVINLTGISSAMKLRRAWIARIEPDKPWRHLGVPLSAIPLQLLG